MTGFEIKQKINSLKKQGKLFTNCAMWMALEDEKEFECKFLSGAVLYALVEDGVNRGFLSYNYEKDAIDIVSSLEADVVFEWPSREKNIMDDFFSKCGFEKITNMIRMSVSDVRPYIAEGSPTRKLFDKSLGRLAVENDAEKINDALRKVFDTKVSHLLDKESLIQEIKKGNVYAEFNQNGDCVAVLQFNTTHVKFGGGGGKFYINQIFNTTHNPSAPHTLLQKALAKCECGRIYVYAWTCEDNIASIKFHAKYGLEPDGLMTGVYKRGENM